MTIRDINEFAFSLAAGERIDIVGRGRYVRHMSGDDVKLATDSGSYITFVAGREYKVAAGDPDFTRIRLHNDGAGAVSGVLMLGFGDVTDNNVVIQDVVATLETPPGTAFMGSQVTGAAASNYSHAQLWNPAGSGVVIEVDRCKVFSNVNGGYNVWDVLSSALATSGNSYAHAKAFGAAPPAPAGELYYERNTSQLVSNWYWMSALDTVAVLSPRDELFIPPVKLDPGYGLVVMNTSVNKDLEVSFQWREVD